MAKSQLGNILVVAGARYLGHAYPLASLASAIRRLTNQSIRVCFVPLASGLGFPAANHFSKYADVVEVREELAQPLDRRTPIGDYADLLRAYHLDCDDRIQKYSSVIRAIFETPLPSLVITDSLPGVPQLAQSLGVPVIAMRSHGLRQRYENGQFRDVFLDLPIDEEKIKANRELSEKITSALGVRVSGISIDDLFYACPTVTPGFENFDVPPAVASDHAFMRLGSLQDKIVRSPSRNALVYIRDHVSRAHVFECLSASGLLPVVVDENASSQVDFWGSDICAAMLVSHGGHGMACAALYQQLPHLTLADTDDRYTVSRRVESCGAGIMLDTREGTLPSRETIISALAMMPRMGESREWLNRNSLSPNDIAEWALKRY